MTTCQYQLTSLQSFAKPMQNTNQLVPFQFNLISTYDLPEHTMQLAAYVLALEQKKLVDQITR